jgi:hypothetical protein
MVLIAVYAALTIIGTLCAYLVGLVVERTAPSASLLAFLAMYFLVLWFSWIVAVRLTEPRKA